MSNTCNYNYDRAIPDLIYPPTNFPNEPSTIDFLEINFSQRLVVDITINRANNPPKVVSLSNGIYAIIKYVYNGVLYKVAGRIRDIQVKNNECDCNSIKPHPIKPKTFGSSIFILEIDCSDRCESRVYNISSFDIRDIDIFDPTAIPDDNKDNKCCCCGDKCNCGKDSGDSSDGDNTDDGSESEGTKDVTITPDVDLEDDNDFGTDPSETEDNT